MLGGIVAYVAFAWLLVMLGVFPSFSKPRSGILFIYFSGTLFLPEGVRGALEIGPLHFTKFESINYAALFAVLLYDSQLISSPKIRWFDLPAIVWSLCPFPSCLMNDPPPDGSSAVKDAISQTLGQAVTWGIPYLMGRLYFSDRSGILALALGIVTAVIVYVPFCLYEVKMSPQLHSMVYGYSQHSFGQTIRFDGWRPMVFLQHGLAVGMVMSVGTVIAIHLWRAKAMQTPSPQTSTGIIVHLGSVSAILFVTTILVKSTGAIVLTFLGLFVLIMSKKMKTRLLLLLLVAIPPTYCTLRAGNHWTGQDLSDFVGEYIGADRQESLDCRFGNEVLLSARALERPLWGWGGWGRNLVTNRAGQSVTIPDGMWVIYFGSRGLVGLISLGMVLLLPVARFALRFPVESWSTWLVSPAAACSVVLALWTIDSLFNAMTLPIYLLISGGLMGLNPGDFRNVEPVASKTA